MLHAIYGSDSLFMFTSEDQRIDLDASYSEIKFLFKFQNDSDGRVVYAYGQNPTFLPGSPYNEFYRYTKDTIKHSSLLNESVYSGKVNFSPPGYWYYWIFEVTWSGTPSTEPTDWPFTEFETGKSSVVQGLIEEGKLLVAEKPGEEEVKYTEKTNTTSTNYIFLNN